MKSSTRITWIVVLAIVVVAAIVYVVVKNSDGSPAAIAPSPSPSPAAQTPSTLPTSSSGASVGVSASGTGGLTVTLSTSTASSGQSKNWVVHSALQYGLSFSYPSNDAFTAGGTTYINAALPFGPLTYTATSTNYAGEGTPVVLGTAVIPATDYPGSDLSGALFGVSVNPSIATSAACATFGNYGIPHVSFPITVNGVAYNHAYVTIALSPGYTGIYDTAHVFRNGRCYEFSLGSQTASANGSAWNETGTLETVLSHASFSAPQ